MASGTTSVGVDAVTFEIDFLEDTALYVEEVYLSNGDTVQTGDKYIKFTEDSIADARSELKSAALSADLSYRSGVISDGESRLQAKYTYDMAVLEAQFAQQVYDDTVAQLEVDYAKSVTAYEDAQQAYDEYFEKIENDTFYEDYDIASLKKAYEEAKELYTERKAYWEVTDEDMFEIAEGGNKSIFYTSYTTVMSIATSDAWISSAMQMLMQTSVELYNHTVNVALLTACIVREDGKRSYDPYQVVLGALLHDIGYAGTVSKARGMPIDGMTDIEKQLLEKHIRLGTNYVENHISSQTVRDIVAMHHEYLDGSGFPAHLTSEHIPRHARIVTVVNEFINQLSNETQKFAPDSVLSVKNKMDILVKNGKIDAEIMEMLYGRLGEISRLLASVSEHIFHF